MVPATRSGRQLVLNSCSRRRNFTNLVARMEKSRRPRPSRFFASDSPAWAINVSISALLAALTVVESARAQANDSSRAVRAIEDERAIKIESDKLEAVIPKNHPKQWMT